MTPEEDLFADETCDHTCRVIGRDGNHRCMDAIARANPDGIGPDLLGFYLGLSKQGAEYVINAALSKLPLRLRRALGDECDAA